MRSTITQIIESISPYDHIEGDHLQLAVNWLKSGAQIFRQIKPNIPEIHLVAYTTLIDPATRQILLVDHKKCNLWIPPGGHVEDNEHPFETAKREIYEELGKHLEPMFSHPVFVTVNETTGDQPGKHTDVSLWYVFKGSISEQLQFDREEFHGIKWFKFDEIIKNKSEPHVSRFIEKLKTYI